MANGSWLYFPTYRPFTSNPLKTPKKKKKKKKSEGAISKVVVERGYQLFWGHPCGFASLTLNVNIKLKDNPNGGQK